MSMAAANADEIEKNWPPAASVRCVRRSRGPAPGPASRARRPIHSYGSRATEPIDVFDRLWRRLRTALSR